jgi:hypothetical protein
MMEKYIIQEELRNCPGIVYYSDSNKLDVVGRSIPENPEIIFRKLEDWIVMHFEKNDSLNINIRLEYINSGSSKYLYEIFKQLKEYGSSGKRVRMRWFYEEDDEAMLELGEHYRDTAGIPFEIEMVI